MAAIMGKQGFLQKSSVLAPCARAGFTLVELVVVVVAITATLLAIAVPGMNGMLSAQKSTALVNSFVVSLHLARGEAIKRNARAVVCKSADGLSCSTSGSWEQGWIVFHDANNNGVLDAGEQVVLQQGPIARDLRLTGNMHVADYVSYSASSSAKLLSGAFQAGTFTMCPAAASSSSDVRLVVLSGTGRPRTQKGTISDCR